MRYALHVAFALNVVVWGWSAWRRYVDWMRYAPGEWAWDATMATFFACCWALWGGR